GARVVAAADDTIPMYAAAASLVPGQPVTQGDVKRVDVQLGASRNSYVAADHDIAPGTFALRNIRPGELLPKSALGSSADINLKPVSVPVDAGAADQLAVGSIVDVWVNAKDPASAT
ncbi:MAG: SAF domain-containing protein, partial [Dermatophilaceae bacterium]